MGSVPPQPHWETKDDKRKKGRGGAKFSTAVERGKYDGPGVMLKHSVDRTPERKEAQPQKRSQSPRKDQVVKGTRKAKIHSEGVR